MTELIRSIGEGGAKPSWEDARQFLLINSTEIKRGGAIPMGTRVELLLPWWMRGILSAGVEKASAATGAQGASLRRYRTLLT